MGSKVGTRGSAAPRTYADLRQDIVTGELPTDTPLLEGALAERYGVSRTPVREALRRLEQDGLVERGARGYEIHRYSPDEIYDIYEARILLEGHAARRDAERHRDVDAWRMKEAHRRMVNLLPENPGRAERVAANQRFHRAIWESADNGTVLEMLTRLYLHLVRHTTLTEPRRWEGALVEHDELLSAIVAREADEAERLMADHIRHGREMTLTRQSGEADRVG